MAGKAAVMAQMVKGEYAALGTAMGEIDAEFAVAKPPTFPRRFEIRRDLTGWHVIGFAASDARKMAVRKVLPLQGYSEWQIREVR